MLPPKGILSTCAALAVLASAAAPALTAGREQAAADAFIKDNPRFGSQVATELRYLLGSLSSTKEHSLFVRKRKKVAFIMQDPGENLSRTTVAKYLPGAVYVNRYRMVVAALRLERRGLPLDEIPEVLAWKMIPVIGHELRHGMIHEDMKDILGYYCPLALARENEVIAYFDEQNIIREVTAKRPELYRKRMLVGHIERHQGRVLMAWDGGLQGLKGYVARYYPKRRWVLETEREVLLASIEATKRQGERRLKSYKKMSAQELAALRAKEDRDPEKAARRLIRKAEECRKTLSTPRMFKKYRKFYRTWESAIGKEWRRYQRQKSRGGR